MQNLRYRKAKIKRHPEHVKIEPLVCICGLRFSEAELHSHVWSN